MLKANIRDVLLNRRNKVEVEDMEVKGEIPASVLKLIQENGIAFDKFYIFIDEKPQIVEDIPNDYSGLSFYFGSDEGLTISGYSHGERLYYNTFASDDIYVNDIFFSQKATVWDTDEDVDTLGDWLDSNYANIKAGDFIMCNGDISFVRYISSSTLTLLVYDNDKTIDHVVYNNGESGWSYDTTVSKSFGTKLYLHNFLLYNGGTSLNKRAYIISADPNPVTDGTDFHDLVQNAVSTMILDQDFECPIPCSYCFTSSDLNICYLNPLQTGTIVNTNIADYSSDLGTGEYSPIPL